MQQRAVGMARNPHSTLFPPNWPPSRKTPSGEVLLVNKAAEIDDAVAHLLVAIYEVLHPYPKHCHNFCELTVTLSGTADHEINEDRHITSAGDVYIFTGNESHCFHNPTDFRVAVVQFSRKVFGSAKSELDQRPGFRALFELEPRARAAHGYESRLKLVPRDLEYVWRMLEEMQRELAEMPLSADLLSKTVFIHLCAFLANRYEQGMHIPKVRSLNKIGEVLNYMETHLCEPFTLKGLGELVGISPRTLLRDFRTCMHTSPVSHLIRLRVERACEWLAQSNWSTLDIALEVGFNSPEYFCRKFRQLMGMSPTEYRNSCSAGYRPSPNGT